MRERTKEEYPLGTEVINKFTGETLKGFISARK